MTSKPFILSERRVYVAGAAVACCEAQLGAEVATLFRERSLQNRPGRVMLREKLAVLRELQRALDASSYDFQRSRVFFRVTYKPRKHLNLVDLVYQGYHFCKRCGSPTVLEGDEFHPRCAECGSTAVKWCPPAAAPERAQRRVA